MSFLSGLGTWLISFGAIGLFAISLLDSAMVPLPSGPDLVMITLSAVEPAWMPLYVLTATLGSTIGCTLMYLAARRAGSTALKRVSPARRERIENLLGRYDMLAVMVPAILPPPFPFKAFVLSAGIFKLKITRFIIAIFIGRTVRFMVEGWLSVEFGEDVGSLITDDGLRVLLAAGLISLIVLAFRLSKRRLFF